MRSYLGFQILKSQAERGRGAVQAVPAPREEGGLPPHPTGNEDPLPPPQPALASLSPGLREQSRGGCSWVGGGRQHPTPSPAVGAADDAPTRVQDPCGCPGHRSPLLGALPSPCPGSALHRPKNTNISVLFGGKAGGMR